MCPDIPPDTLVALIAAVPTAIVGLIGLHIAHQQAKTNRQQANTNLQRLRYEQHSHLRRTYDGVDAYLSAITRGLKPDAMLKALFKFKRVRSEARFLFEVDIENYLDELIGKGAQLRRLRQSAQGQPLKGADAKREKALILWFSDQYDEAPSRFDRALRVSGRG